MQSESFKKISLRNRMFFSLPKSFVITTLTSVIFCASSVKANAETVCKTNSMGDKNCITASERNGNFSGKISWTYKVSRNTVVPGKSVKYSEWGTNVICSSRTGVVTYVVLKDSKNKTIPLSQTQLKNMNAGLTNSALPQIIGIFCG
jgi:hypothetical protein